MKLFMFTFIYVWLERPNAFHNFLNCGLNEFLNKNYYIVIS